MSSSEFLEYHSNNQFSIGVFNEKSTTMMGSGFMKDMINSARSNRILLKKGDGHAYTPFDTASYPINKKSNKKASYRKASPAHLQSIKITLSKANRRFCLKY